MSPREKFYWLVGGIVCILVLASLIGWIPLSWPAQAIDGVLPDYYRWCGGTLQLATNTPQMYVCSAAVGVRARPMLDSKPDAMQLRTLTGWR